MGQKKKKHRDNRLDTGQHRSQTKTQNRNSHKYIAKVTFVLLNLSKVGKKLIYTQ